MDTESNSSPITQGVISPQETSKASQFIKRQVFNHTIRYRLQDLTCRIRQCAHVNFIQLVNTTKWFTRLGSSLLCCGQLFRSRVVFSQHFSFPSWSLFGWNSNFWAWLHSSPLRPDLTRAGAVLPDLHPHVCFTVHGNCSTVSRAIPLFVTGFSDFRLTCEIFFRW